MQIKSKMPDSGANVFKKTAGMISNWAEGQRENFIKKAYQRNEGAYYDETLFSVWGLLILSTLITAAGGIYYHYTIFNTAFSYSWLALGGSLLLFMIAEICLVYFGLVWLRSLYNGIWKQTFADVGIFLGLGLIVMAAGAWDYHVNTQAISKINDLINTIEIKQETFAPPLSIATLDIKIQEVDATIAQARKSTWKGRPTAEGLAVIKENSILKGELLKQQAEALAIAKTEHDGRQLAELSLAKKTAHQLADYGRMTVFAKCLFILLIPLFELKNFEVSLVEDPAEKPAEKPAENFAEDPAENFAEVGYHAIQNRTRETPTENRGGPEYTQSHKIPTPAEKPAEPKKIRIVEEVVEDAEKAVIQLCGKIQKFYPARWRKVAEKGGKLSTMATNFQTFLQEIQEIQEEQNVKLPAKWEERVENYKSIFLKEIKPHL